MRYFKTAILVMLCSSILLLVSRCNKDQDEQETREAITNRLITDISADSLEANVAWLEDMGTRFALADNHREVAVKIRDRFVSMQYTETKLDSFEISREYFDYRDSKLTIFEQWQYNVVATLKGDSHSDSVCIIGAHYDDITGSGEPFTIAPGANDNASGVAAALEIARVMKKNNYHPANTIKFVAFGSEELGLFGSRAYTENAVSIHEKIKLMLNNDMIAYEPRSDKAEWKVNIIDYDNSHPLRNRAESLCSRYTILGYYNDNSSSKYSDSYPFYQNGYKALFFFSDILDPEYHHITDVTSHCNFEYCREIVILNCALLVDQN